MTIDSARKRVSRLGEVSEARPKFVDDPDLTLPFVGTMVRGVDHLDLLPASREPDLELVGTLLKTSRMFRPTMWPTLCHRCDAPGGGGLKVLTNGHALYPVQMIHEILDHNLRVPTVVREILMRPAVTLLLNDIRSELNRCSNPHMHKDCSFVHGDLSLWVEAIQKP